MAKLERLLNLTAALLETERPLSADDLRRRVPGYPDGLAAFRRTFERDKEDLREMGVPLELVPLPGTDPPVDGYRIPKNEYYLDDPGLAPDELAALHLASSTVPFEGAGGLEGLWKLGGTDPATRPADPSTEISALPGDPRLADLFAALAARTTVSFTYNDEEREVEPQRLDFQRGRWYLTGHDRRRDDERNFRLDRMGPDISTGARFEPRPATEAGRRRQPWELGEGSPVTARLLVDADQAAWAVQHVGRDRVIDERPDGSVVFEIEVTSTAGFRSFVLTFLEHAEVLEPSELRADLITWLEAV
jgi:proteasome accessory factor B